MEEIAAPLKQGSQTWMASWNQWRHLAVAMEAVLRCGQKKQSADPSMMPWSLPPPCQEAATSCAALTPESALSLVQQNQELQNRASRPSCWATTQASATSLVPLTQEIVPSFVLLALETVLMPMGLTQQTALSPTSLTQKCADPGGIDPERFVDPCEPDLRIEPCLGDPGAGRFSQP